MENLKKCSGCKTQQPIANFHKNKLTHDGHSNYCRDCSKNNAKKYFQKKKITTNLTTQSLNTEVKLEILMRIGLVEKLLTQIGSELKTIKNTYDFENIFKLDDAKTFQLDTIKENS